MITKAEGRLKPVYLIKNSKCLCASKDIIILISLLSFVSAFLSACQKSDYDSNFSYTSGAVQLSTEATQIPNNDELRWTWCIESDKYIDLFFVDLDLIAAKESDGQYIIINTNGDTVIPFKYSSVSRFYDGIAVVKDNGNSFFIDKKGENVFDEVYEEAYSFSNALAAVKKEGLWGFIDRTGKTVITNQFDEANSFNEDLAAIKKNGKWGVVDKSGRIVADFQFDSISHFHNGYMAVMKDGKWGFINSLGEIAVDCQFDKIKDFSEGYAAVMKDGKWGFINNNSKICIALKYDDVGNFSEGKASVKISKHKDGLDEWAYIDGCDNVVIKFYPYDSAGEQMFSIGEFNDGLSFVSKSLLSIIDNNGNNVFLGGNSKFFISSLSYNKRFDAIPAYVYLDNDMKIKKFGLMGLKGNQRLEPIFDYISEIYGDYVVVENVVNGEYKMGIIKIVSGLETTN